MCGLPCSNRAVRTRTPRGVGGGRCEAAPYSDIECLLDGIRDLTITRMAVSVADNDFYCIGPGRQCDTRH